LSTGNEFAIKRMAEYLRQGAKMLSINCPECNNPLFKLKSSEILCPSCQKTVIIPEYNLGSQSKVDNSQKKQSLSDIMMWELQELKNKLMNEKDISTIKDILKSINLIVKILKDLKEIQGI